MADSRYDAIAPILEAYAARLDHTQTAPDYGSRGPTTAERARMAWDVLQQPQRDNPSREALRRAMLEGIRPMVPQGRGAGRVFLDSLYDNTLLNLPSAFSEAPGWNDLGPDESRAAQIGGALAGGLASFLIPGGIIGKGVQLARGANALNNARRAAQVVQRGVLPAIAGAAEAGRQQSEIASGADYNLLERIGAPVGQAMLQRWGGGKVLQGMFPELAQTASQGVGTSGLGALRRFTSGMGAGMTPTTKMAMQAALEGAGTGAIAGGVDEGPGGVIGQGLTGAVMGGSANLAIPGAARLGDAVKNRLWPAPAPPPITVASMARQATQAAPPITVASMGRRAALAQALGSPPGAATAQAAPPAAAAVPSAGAPPASSSGAELIPGFPAIPLPQGYDPKTIEMFARLKALEGLPVDAEIRAIPEDLPRLARVYDPVADATKTVRLTARLPSALAESSRQPSHWGLDAAGKPVALTRDELAGAEQVYTSRIGNQAETSPIPIQGPGWRVHELALASGEPGTFVTAHNPETGSWQAKTAQGWRMFDAHDPRPPKVEALFAAKPEPPVPVRQPASPRKTDVTTEAQVAAILKVIQGSGLTPEARQTLIKQLRGMGKVAPSGSKKVVVARSGQGQPPGSSTAPSVDQLLAMIQGS